MRQDPFDNGDFDFDQWRRDFVREANGEPPRRQRKKVKRENKCMYCGSTMGVEGVRLEKLADGYICNRVKCDRRYTAEHAPKKVEYEVEPIKRDPFIRRPIPSSVRDFVYARDGYKCRYCDGPAEALDHIRAFSRGGEDTPDNLAACCQRCNSKLHDAVFHSAAEKRAWIQARLKEERQKRQQCREMTRKETQP
jgi:5-methylcytosine-specific restriction endonuclease McrA